MCFRPPSFNQLMTKCPACNTFNPPSLKKCKKCGADLPEPDPEEANKAQTSPAANERKTTIKRTNPPSNPPNDPSK